MTVNDESGFVWSDCLKSGHPGIDAIHEEFVVIVDAVAQAAETDLDTLLERLERHCTEHFEQERELMIRHGFPAAACHIAEHAEVLASVAEVRALADTPQRRATTRRLARSLAEWFEGHLTYLDSALAQWIVRRTHGGTPVVVRRNPTRSPESADAVGFHPTSRTGRARA